MSRDRDFKIASAISEPSKRLVILGATGSIGRQTLQICRNFSDRLRVVGLASYGSNPKRLLEFALEFKPEAVAVISEEAYNYLKTELKGVDLLVGYEGLMKLVDSYDYDTLISAMVGFVGLKPTLYAAELGKRIALANKESLVVAGHLFDKHLSRIVPIDSEHSAVFQCIQAVKRDHLKSVVLTASGGPFLDVPYKYWKDIKPEQALKHPRWNMGEKITIDSATMMNKALEIIEARWLFELTPDMIEVLIHPQSIVHSMIRLRDGSLIAQLSVTDMRLPILLSLSFPERWDIGFEELQLLVPPELNFSQPPDKFKAIKLAYQVLKSGYTYPCVMNAADEIAVQAFIKGKLRFDKIVELVEEVLNRHVPPDSEPTVELLEDIDRWARNEAMKLIDGIFSNL